MFNAYYVMMPVMLAGALFLGITTDKRVTKIVGTVYAVFSGCIIGLMVCVESFRGCIQLAADLLGYQADGLEVLITAVLGIVAVAILYGAACDQIYHFAATRIYISHTSAQPTVDQPRPAVAAAPVVQPTGTPASLVISKDEINDLFTELRLGESAEVTVTGRLARESVITADSELAIPANIL